MSNSPHSSDILTVHGVVARIIDVPSQGITYMRIEVPIEYHAELTRQFYGKPVILARAGDAMKGAPYGPMIAGASSPEPPRPTIKAPSPAELPKGGKLSVDAAMICGDQAFMHYAYQQETGDLCGRDQEFGPDDAAQFMRSFCGVDSRAMLDHDAAAASQFRHLMVEYRTWRLRQPEYGDA